MKHTLLISLGRESFSNVSVEFEGTAEEAIAEGKRLLSLPQGGSGLSQKEMADYMCKALNSIKGPDMLEMWEKCTPSQQIDLRALRNAMERKPLEEKEIE